MWLVDRGIRTGAALRQLEVRRKIVPLTRGCRNTPKVYEYASLPEQMKREIDGLLDVYKSCHRNLLEPYIHHDAVLREYFDTYKTARGQYLPNSESNPVRDTYYFNGIVLDAMLRMKKDPAYRRLTWNDVVEQLQGLSRLEYPTDLPESGKKLQEKARNYELLGPESLVHKNYRRSEANATKVEEGAQKSMLIALISEHRNFDSEEIARLYNGYASAKGWKTISSSLVKKMQHESRLLTTASKHGAAVFRNEIAVTVQRSAPSKAMYMWVLDGWDAELLYQKKDVKGRVTYHNRLTLEVVLDASTRYPIGWALGESESAGLIREALRNAERHVEELTGSMLRPYQLQMDNFARKALEATYSGLAQYVTPARVGNAKAKVIEPWFHYFNDKYCKYQLNWSGHGVTAGKQGQPNLDITLARKKDLPTLEELVEQIADVLDQYRRDALPAYRDAMAALPESERMPLGMKEYLSLFGEQRARQYSLGSRGIAVEVGGRTLQYDLVPRDESPESLAEAIRFREHCWERWNMKYDPQDARAVLVENDQKTEQYVLYAKDVQPMALKDRKPGDYERLEAVRKFNRALEVHVTETLSAHQERAIEQVRQDRKDYEMLSKALITDSTGSHKSVKAGARLQEDAFKAATDVQEESLYDLY